MIAFDWKCVALLTAVGFFCVRLWPIWPIKYQGCDAYYFLLCAEAFKKTFRIPIRLPNMFLLELEEQWYPPGFMVFCGLFPEKLLKNYYWLINHLIDSIIAAGLFASVLALIGSPWFAFGAVFAYASAAFIVSEYSNLTSRPLGAFLQVSFIVTTFAWMQTGEWVLLPTSILLGVLLIFTHKLSLQLLWFLIPFLAIAMMDWRWFVPIAGAYVTSMIFCRGLFFKIVRAHWDIISFWYRNWRWLGAHLVEDSPIYGSMKDRTGFYKNAGPAAWLEFVRNVLHMNYFILFLPVGFWYYDSLGAIGTFCLWWALGVYLWAAAIYFVLPLRAIGQGGQYVKFAQPPVLILTAIVLDLTTSPVLIGIAVILLGLTLRYYWLTAKGMRSRIALTSGRLSPDLERILKIIRDDATSRTLALPLHLSELTAYHTRRPVCWGTHGFGFKNAEPLYPIIRKPLDWFVETYALTHLLLDERYTLAKNIGVAETALVCRNGNYALYQLSISSRCG